MIFRETQEMFSYSALSEYLIIALPYAEIGEEVKAFKRDFFKQYGAYSGQNSCAHIRLMSFFQSEEREEKILQEVQGALNEIKPFEVFLNGFGFNGAHRDVYLEVLNKQSIIDVYDTLRVRLFNALVSLAFLNNRYEPVMGVAQSLSPLQFLNAIRDYEQVAYTNNFRISRLHVLKRKAPFNTWENLTALPFAKSEGELLGLF